ncbi:RagB/SusD family nutrient uptake outer membrane protein [Flavobacterium aquiphilum]|uniref:RagB/SusD family nutrient uptake outer membrane protein n=1 Tax=Flavobacterium aquiphilum TaxID=3003261 RepID=UPI0024804182|nr:RagB/SusD family nutrient uptake outer membrane protein [Flavobacterium aquiphilum]
MKIKINNYCIVISPVHYRRVIPVLGVLFLFLSCDSFTQVDLPSSQLNADDVFEDKATATAALTEIYSNLRDNGVLTGYPSGVSCQLGLYCDELDFYGIPASGNASFFNNGLLPSTSDVSLLWSRSYTQIYAANAVIEGVTHSTVLSHSDRDKIIGEALFIRALVHFYLVNLFGDIPYITQTDYLQNKAVKRMSVQAVYQNIKDDLTEASLLMTADYPTTERVRPNKWAAKALLARVLLYLQQWDQASEEASAVIIQSSLYRMPTDIIKVFLKDSPSTIWQFMPSAAGANTREGSLFIFQTGPPPSFALTNGFVSSFDANDLRKLNWIRKVTTGTNSWYHAYKYKQSTSTGTSVEYSIVLRLAELYLIRAEARAMQGDFIGSQQDINVIRNYAGLSNTAASTQSALIDEIIKQRRLEFFCEFGHRFFDLKRMQKLDETLQKTKPGWNTSDKLLPIPESELSLNPNLAPQNDGY